MTKPSVTIDNEQFATYWQKLIAKEHMVISAADKLGENDKLCVTSLTR